MALRQAESRALVDDVIDQLKAAITNGTLEAGDRLHQEDLAERLGVSRTPLRQALIALTREGLIVEGRKGFVVATLGLQETADLYEISAVLDGVAARMAAERATADDLVRLHAAVEHGPVLATGDDALDFHRAVAEVARCSPLVRIRSIILASAELAVRSDAVAESARRTGDTPGDEAAARAEHRRILQAIGDGDGEVAQRLATEHVLAGRSRLRRAADAGRLS